MTVLSRGARVRRGGRRPGWVLLTALLVLAIGASSALVFTDRVELLKLAVLLALWAAVAGAFVSVVYRRQSDSDRARAHDLKLVYDLQLDREISARREYELTVESQLRRELASEMRAQAADEVATLRAELAALRTSLEILFDTDLAHRPALGTPEKPLEEEARALSDRAQNGESPPTDWVSSDRVTPVRGGDAASRTDDTSIIDVPEVGVLAHDERVGELRHDEPVGAPPGGAVPQPDGGGPPGPRQQPEYAREHDREPVQRPYQSPPSPQPDLPLQPRHRRPTPPPLQHEPPQWQPVTGEGQWLPPGTPGSHWAAVDAAASPAAPPSGRRGGPRHSGPEDRGDTSFAYTEFASQYSESGRRSRSRHSAESRDDGPGHPGSTGGPPGSEGLTGAETSASPPSPPAAAPEPPPPRLAPAPPPEPAPRHRGPDRSPDGRDSLGGSHGRDPQTGGQSVADLLARLQAEPSGGGRRRRRGD